ncbi:MAG: hypothetical protein M0Z84_07770 [Gammaproteobacteria bacterium]|nr:hypothetical protein [Gammaproteobacteria bacterium]
MTTRRVILALLGSALLAGCATTSKPVEIGANTYYLSKTNTAGAFGDVGTLAQSLMVEGNKFCAKKDLHFQIVTEDLRQPVIGLGGATIQFKCVTHLGPVDLRPDKGITTIN